MYLSSTACFFGGFVRALVSVDTFMRSKLSIILGGLLLPVQDDADADSSSVLADI